MYAGITIQQSEAMLRSCTRPLDHPMAFDVIAGCSSQEFPMADLAPAAVPQHVLLAPRAERVAMWV